MLETVKQIARNFTSAPAQRPTHSAEASQAPRRVELRNPHQVESDVLTIDPEILRAMSAPTTVQAKPAA